MRLILITFLVTNFAFGKEFNLHSDNSVLQIINSSTAIVEQAIAKSSGEQRELYQKIRNKIQNDISLYIPELDEDELRECADERIYAYVIPAFENVIFLCLRYVKTNPGLKDLSQSIIHEAVHHLGIPDEQKATEIELDIMYKSDVGIVFYNDYALDMGIKDLPSYLAWKSKLKKSIK